MFGEVLVSSFFKKKHEKLKNLAFCSVTRVQSWHRLLANVFSIKVIVFCKIHYLFHKQKAYKCIPLWTKFTYLQRTQNSYTATTRAQTWCCIIRLKLMALFVKLLWMINSVGGVAIMFHFKQCNSVFFRLTCSTVINLLNDKTQNTIAVIHLIHNQLNIVQLQCTMPPQVFSCK